MTKDEILAAKIARLRKYINNECPHGVPSSVLLKLMDYENQLESYMIDEMGEYRFHPGDHWTPPEEELLNEGEIKNCCEEAIQVATEDETWTELDDNEKADLAELLDLPYEENENDAV